MKKKYPKIEAKYFRMTGPHPQFCQRLIRLIYWREIIAREVDIPAKLLLPDSVLSQWANFPNNSELRLPHGTHLNIARSVLVPDDLTTPKCIIEEPEQGDYDGYYWESLTRRFFGDEDLEGIQDTVQTIYCEREYKNFGLRQAPPPDLDDLDDSDEDQDTFQLVSCERDLRQAPPPDLDDLDDSDEETNITGSQAIVNQTEVTANEDVVLDERNSIVVHATPLRANDRAVLDGNCIHQKYTFPRERLNM